METQGYTKAEISEAYEKIIYLQELVDFVLFSDHQKFEQV